MLKIRKFGELSFREQLCFSEALCLQVWVGLLLKFIPFKRIPRLFAATGAKIPARDPGAELFVLEQVKQAIQRTGRISPWKNTCLVQSLAARLMLNRRKISSRLSLGVAKTEASKVIAHAWLKSGDFEIVAMGGDFQELYLF